MREHGDTVGEAWKAILVNPDRYRSVAYEDLFSAVASTGDPELVGWEHYQRARYIWALAPPARITPFHRGLSEDFFAWLQTGPGKKLVTLFKKECLDVRLRDNYLNAYLAQCSLANLRWYDKKQTASLAIHKAFLRGSPLARGRDRRMI